MHTVQPLGSSMRSFAELLAFFNCATMCMSAPVDTSAELRNGC
ncbi:hypothetical protein SNOG_12613 [Parastagonospora nodorum SN15]|uniref:Uncharacterized protein n=1 Tax=Phaeosphaeria nodorum (strain SN15 / ATCC MYA-4574 / FGSC 10173) TaxID=321614 RepID=Q0U6K1_PHANO|nr:hypothetical protein SNOG_12613 [Parastagonospora nodorum SN15]EAT79911.1 hypothetical protein SNOG_12613 [Parastagonospora nodorum SN15]